MKTIDGLAPVAVFAYKRSGHLERTLESLALNPLASATDLHVYCDGARSRADEAGVAAVRDLVRAVTGFASVRTIERDANLGLARSIISGTSEVVERTGRVIVIEDDLVLSPHFLRYMNDGLDRYANEDAVASIHGYCYPVDEPLPSTFFLRGGDCWGWATWSRAWRHFEPDGTALLSRLRARGLTRGFDLDGAYPFTRMLEDQAAGRNDSWAIRWHASCFLAGRLTLYPGRSLVDNIGNDSSGTHCGSTDSFSTAVSADSIAVGDIAIVESAQARDAFKRFHRRQHGVVARARSFIGRATGRAV